MYTANSDGVANAFNASLPATYDYLKPNGFRFVIKDLPNVSYTCQKVTLPSLNVGFAEFSTPNINLFFADRKTQFGEFSIEFIVAENMQNFIEVYKWLIALGDLDESILNEFVKSRIDRYPLSTSYERISENIKYSDATLFILNSANNPKVAVKFADLFPTSLTPLSFDTTVDNIQYFVCGATFKYTSYEIETL